MEIKENETSWLLVIGSALGVLLKWKPLVAFAEKLLTRWLDGRLSRQMSRRLTDAELDLILQGGGEDLDTLVLLIQSEWQADRVTLVEYDCPKDGPVLATCLIEHREPDMPPVKAGLQRRQLEDVIWQEIQRIHSSPLCYLFVRDVRAMDIPVLRTQLIRSGVRSAYYQSMPARAGHCAAMLSVSWSEEVELSEEELEGLRFSGRTLAYLLRMYSEVHRAAA